MRIPLWVEASRLRVLVLGGGSVGTRRAKYFHEAGARVRVIAREVTKELEALGVEIKRADLREHDPSEDIRWADVVVIAVDDSALALKLFRQAEAAGKLVNDATDASRTHVIVPYERVVAGLRIAVTSEGAAGAPARLSLDVIENCIRKSWVPLFYEIYKELKREAKSRLNDAKVRMQFYRELCEDEEFTRLIKSGNRDAALARGLELLNLIAGAARGCKAPNSHCSPGAGAPRRR
ncbi:MAG: bifunctional precorrin-2 dehydrogenase/sirohydrochlorin ferrochelatase [Thermoproteaceae archaeon]|jgi:precorrin-2 dehydrogenase/sirohydrochlorin ferrochelatase|nr:bifunctional precorrin-2 dehydrogenase/sirohydrochlorin ferrochelatase [Thermoproteaceae archaeon]